uniref:RRM domain-containing protein n=1 Tax=Glossina pallidipes TaxID=7398 RepID=A0A1A9ZJG2_GLOPL
MLELADYGNLIYNTALDIAKEVPKPLRMENVIAFNNELSGLYDTKPPISKAKMAGITKAAMRAIKFYKHVVQSVEKFILKCKPEYKVPGLYVIDSIVRQSRHQFGAEKDVFAPRFARNIKETFANLFRCASEDKSRIIRVLNLWQKNNVFAPDVIQPIFDLADPNHPIYSMQSGNAVSVSGAVSLSVTSGNPINSVGLNDVPCTTSNGLNTSGAGVSCSGTSMDMITGGSSHTAVPVLLEDKLNSGALTDLSSVSHDSSKSHNLNNFRHVDHSKSKRSANSSGSGIAHLLASQSTSCAKLREHTKLALDPTAGGTTKVHHTQTYTKYHRSLQEDYENTQQIDDNISEGLESPKTSSNLLDNNNLKQLLNDPNVLRQLQTLQNFQKFKQEDKQHNLRLHEEAFEKHLHSVLKNSGPGPSSQDVNDFNKEVEFVSEEQKIEVINLDGNDSRSPTPERDRYKRRRSRSRSRSHERLSRRRRSRTRSRSRSRSPRLNRRRSSRDRDRSNRDRDRDREHERERRKKGLPDIRKEHLSVCSTTLWVGHLSKLVYQEELSDTFGEYGDIISIDQIVPRGCAFIVMNRRQDAYKAMQSLKNHKLQGRAISISWAAGKGVKSKEWKDFWDLELGVTFIPWNKLNDSTDFDSLEEGGMFDEDSMPSWMKDKINKIKNLKEKAMETAIIPSSLGSSSAGIAPGTGQPMIFNIDTTQPPPLPPSAQSGGGPPPMLPMVPSQFSIAPPMGGPPRMLGPPISMPISGLHMSPNIVQPHAAMMMMPSFGHIQSQVGPNGPPGMGPPHISPMGTTTSATVAHAQFPLSQGGQSVSALPTNIASISDDHMDIEMEDADGVTAVSQANVDNSLNFSQPPPSFTAPSNAVDESNVALVVSSGSELFNRERIRTGNSGNSSRWGGRSGPEDNNESRWRESEAGSTTFQSQGGRVSNMSGVSIERVDFMNDFDSRMGGPRGGTSYNGGEFHPTIPHRFNQPTNLMQMRIPPPNSFNPRAPGGPPMFLRGQSAAGRCAGFYNRNNSFDRDSNSFGARSSLRGRGGGANRARHNWDDEEVDDVGGFKRRGPGTNRFREREGADDRFCIRENRGGRRGSVISRDRKDNDREWECDNRVQGPVGNRCNSREDTIKPAYDALNKTSNPAVSDTEDDWDRELQEYDSHSGKTEKLQEFEAKGEQGEIEKDNKEVGENISVEKTVLSPQMENENAFKAGAQVMPKISSMENLASNIEMKTMPVFTSDISTLEVTKKPDILSAVDQTSQSFAETVILTHKNNSSNAIQQPQDAIDGSIEEAKNATEA